MENTVETLVEAKMQLEKTIDSLIRAFAHENKLPLDKISGQIGTHGRVSFMGIICDENKHNLVIWTSRK